MEEKSLKHISKPGIAEAIHPEIGNGALWEKDPHQLLLRMPDPTLGLGRHLEYEDSQLLESKEHNLSNNLDTSDPGPNPQLKESLEEQERFVQESPKQSEDLSAIQGLTEKQVRKKKKKAKNKEDGSSELDDKSPKSLPDEEFVKPPKTGKLIRKAAKTVEKQAKTDQNQEKSEEPTTFEPALSPYTQWLKSLSGSEYVHPYDDDFAFTQGEGPAKEGISETFADLLASQGYKEQAEEMYIKLMEKYPEKSGFFAAKIKALQ